MGDHFVLLVDRLLTESTLAAALESMNPKSLESPEESEKKISHRNENDRSGKLVECRICQDDDEDWNMETPCSCCGSLKYAHRNCVQRWCNEKGDTICEICLQQFKPGYTAPPQLFHYGSIPMNFRGNWEVSRREILNRRYIAMVSVDPNLQRTDQDGVYSSLSSRTMTYCRCVASTIMVLLFLGHTLPLFQSRERIYSLTVMTIASGIVLLLYILLRTVSHFLSWRGQFETWEIPTPSPPAQRANSRAHFIHVQ